MKRKKKCVSTFLEIVRQIQRNHLQKLWVVRYPQEVSEELPLGFESVFHEFSGAGEPFEKK